MIVADVMLTNVKTVEAKAFVNDAAKAMADYAIGALPVTDSGKPVGMVTDRGIALKSDVDMTDAFAVISSPPPR